MLLFLRIPCVIEMDFTAIRAMADLVSENYERRMISARATAASIVMERVKNISNQYSHF